MFTGDSSFSQIRLAVAGKDDLLAKIFALTGKLDVGQIIKGKVLDVLPDGKAVVNFSGQNVVVENAASLAKGQTVAARIEQTSPNVLLRVAADAEPQSAAPVSRSPAYSSSKELVAAAGTGDTVAPFSNPERQAVTQSQRLAALSLQPGQIIEAEVLAAPRPDILQIQYQGETLAARNNLADAVFVSGRKVLLEVTQNGPLLELEAQPGGHLKPVDAAMLKPYLPARQDLGAITAQLEKLISGNDALLPGLNTDNTALEKLRATLTLLAPDAGAAPGAAKLQAVVDRSGVNYESKVRRVLEAGAAKEGLAELDLDLKGQLLRLKEHLEKTLARVERHAASLPAQADEPATLPVAVKMTREALQQISKAVDGIEFHQLANQFARQQGEPVLIQIPALYGAEPTTAQLYVRSDGEKAGEGNADGKKTYHLVFLLEMTALGNLRVDAGLTDKELTLKFAVENDAAAQFIASHLDGLREQMRALGIAATASCVAQKKVEMEVPNSLQRVLLEGTARLVDIKT